MSTNVEIVQLDALKNRIIQKEKFEEIQRNSLLYKDEKFEDEVKQTSWQRWEDVDPMLLAEQKAQQKYEQQPETIARVNTFVASCCACKKVFPGAEVVNSQHFYAHGLGSTFKDGQLMPGYGSCYDQCFSWSLANKEMYSEWDSEPGKEGIDVAKICDGCIDEWVKDGKLVCEYLYPNCLMCDKQMTCPRDSKSVEVITVSKRSIHSSWYHGWRKLTVEENKKLDEFLSKLPLLMFEQKDQKMNLLEEIDDIADEKILNEHFYMGKSYSHLKELPLFGIGAVQNQDPVDKWLRKGIWICCGIPADSMSHDPENSMMKLLLSRHKVDDTK